MTSISNVDESTASARMAKLNLSGNGIENCQQTGNQLSQTGYELSQQTGNSSSPHETARLAENSGFKMQTFLHDLYHQILKAEITV